MCMFLKKKEKIKFPKGGIVQTENERLIEAIRPMLKFDEGEVKNKNGRHIIYKDSKGILTIGHGRNLEALGLSDDEANYLFNNDIKNAITDSIKIIGQKDWAELGFNQKLAVINMMFNMGFSTLSQFKNTLALIKADKYESARVNALKSLWAKQVKGRAVRVTNLLIDKITGYKLK